jgi:hypothetical protein
VKFKKRQRFNQLFWFGKKKDKKRKRYTDPQSLWRWCTSIVNVYSNLPNSKIFIKHAVCYMQQQLSKQSAGGRGDEKLQQTMSLTAKRLEQTLQVTRPFLHLLSDH